MSSVAQIFHSTMTVESHSSVLWQDQIWKLTVQMQDVNKAVLEYETQMTVKQVSAFA